MARARQDYGIRIATVMQLAATGILAMAALAATASSVAAAAGVLPWLNLPLTFGTTTFDQAGIAVQSGFALMLVMILAFLPTTWRVLKLEMTHRDFSICMSDVADAYAACHRADRAETFSLSDEFDAVKERIQFLRRHPDLGSLEPDVIEAAAQMSYVSRELAETYSDKNVARARDFLKARQIEIENFRERIGQATQQCHELKRYLEQVELEEEINESQLRRMEDHLGETLAELGFHRSSASRDGNVVAMPSATAAE